MPATGDGGQYKRRRPNEDVRAVADHCELVGAWGELS